MSRTIPVVDVRDVIEPEPAIVEVTVVLDGGSTETLRMNVFTLQKLSQAIRPLAERH